MMTRDDFLVLLNGIMRYCEDRWMFADLDEEEIRQAYADLNRFDSDEDIGMGILSWLEDERDICEEIDWSIGIVCDYIRTCFPHRKETRA